MTKLKEILKEIFPSIVGYTYDHKDMIELKLREYAEWYAKECLKVAAENVKIKVREFYEGEYSKAKLYDYLDNLDNSCALTDEDGCLYQVNAYDVDVDSILNIKLPEHDKTL